MPSPIDIGLDLFKNLVWDVWVKAVLGRLFAAVPLFGWGPIGFFVTSMVMKFTDALYSSIKEFINIEAIEFRNKEFGKAYATASVKLKIIAREKGIDSPEFRSARDADKIALSNLARFGPAR
jgi:hypothetical protein